MHEPENTPVAPSNSSESREWTVLHSRSISDLDLLQSDLIGADIRSADLFLRFVRESSSLSGDEDRLLSVVSEFTFQAFPQATHLAIVVRDPSADHLDTLLSRGRDGVAPPVALSRTLVQKVMGDGMALLYAQDPQALNASESIRMSRIHAAMCAPLSSREQTFGVIQLDVRAPGKGTFGRKDVDRLLLFGHHVALVLDNLRLTREQHEALESTIRALIRSLSFKDPETANHSERVQVVSVVLGRAMGLTGSALDALRIAAVLHDMGKQGVRDEVLFKASALTDLEREEMSRHAHLTQEILDTIRYPAGLRDVPRIAAYHHEKLNGEGPYRVPAEQIPIQSRIISVADVFDALISARAYKKPMTPAQALAVLDRGRGIEWDGGVIDALEANMEEIVETHYAEVAARSAGEREAA